MKTLHDSLYAVRHSDSQGTAMRPSCPRMPTTDASACNRVMTHAPQPRRRHAIVRIMRTMAGMMRLSTGVDGLRIECKSPAERRGFMFASAGNRWRVETRSGSVSAGCVHTADCRNGQQDGDHGGDHADSRDVSAIGEQHVMQADDGERDAGDEYTRKQHDCSPIIMPADAEDDSIGRDAGEMNADHLEHQRNRKIH